MNAHAIEGLRKAVPYLRLFQGQTFVIKLGGEALLNREDATRILEQVGVLHQLGIRSVLVHGGGPQATSLAERLGVESEFVGGRRVTNPEMLEAMVLALNGQAQATMLAACRELGFDAVGLSGIDAGLVVAERRKAGDVNFGEVGDITSVNPEVLEHLLDGGYLPIVSPLSADAGGNILNINADTVAASLAASLEAAKLILVTGAPGVLRDKDDPLSVISHLDIQALQKLEKSGAIAGGMLPKAASIASALEGGVGRVHVISYQTPDSLLMEVFTNEGCGTLIVRDEAELMPGEM